MIYLAFFIFIILIFIFIIWFNNYKNTECFEINQFDLTKESYKSFNSQNIEIKPTESLVMVGEIPQDYHYWTVGIFDENGIAQNSINMSNYQTTFPGSTIAIVCSTNIYAIDETCKLIKEKHYKKYPNRKIFFEKVYLSTNIIKLKFDYYLRLDSEKSLPFSLFQYKFKNIPFLNYKLNDCKSNFIIEKSINTNIIKTINKQFNNYKSINIKNNIISKYKPVECIINCSEKIKCENEIVVIAFDHFMNRTAIHSHIIFIDADTNEIYKINYTGIISSKINNQECQITHTIKFKPKCKDINIYVIEKIFFDSNKDYISNNKKINEMIVYSN